MKKKLKILYLVLWFFRFIQFYQQVSCFSISKKILHGI